MFSSVVVVYKVYDFGLSLEKLFILFCSEWKKCEPSKRFVWGQRVREQSMRTKVIWKAEENGGNVQSRGELRW